jgi:UDP-glucose 4-epimerase
VNTNIAAQYRDTRVLVLGASGFIGRWVTRRLMEMDADLVVAVRNPASMEDEALPGSPLQVDLLDFGAVSDLIDQTRPAVIFNLAGYGIDPNERLEDKARLINSELPPLLLESLHPLSGPQWRGQRIVHTGSALEYGKCGGDLAESTTAEPTTLYGRTKLAGTQSLQEASISSGIASVTARLFTVYGPGERPGRLLPSLLETARTGSCLEMTAGTQMRDFTYVEDIAEGLLRLGTVQTLQPNIVNLATGLLLTVRQFIETAAEILGIPEDHLKFDTLPVRQEEMEHEPVSIRKLEELTSWAPSVSISQGIMRTRNLAGNP